jgi:hypothetical protein
MKNSLEQKTINQRLWLLSQGIWLTQQVSLGKREFSSGLVKVAVCVFSLVSS